MRSRLRAKKSGGCSGRRASSHRTKRESVCEKHDFWRGHFCPHGAELKLSKKQMQTFTCKQLATQYGSKLFLSIYTTWYVSYWSVGRFWHDYCYERKNLRGCSTFLMGDPGWRSVDDGVVGDH